MTASPPRRSWRRAVATLIVFNDLAARLATDLTSAEFAHSALAILYAATVAPLLVGLTALRNRAAAGAHAVEPTAEHYYSLAVINFTKWVPDWLKARSDAKMRQDEPGPLKDPKARAALKEKDGALVDEAVGYLKKALELDPEYENAMAYLNLMLRQPADYLDSKEDYDKNIAEADQWLQKYLDTKKIKAEREAKKAAGGIQQEAK